MSSTGGPAAAVAAPSRLELGPGRAPLGSAFALRHGLASLEELWFDALAALAARLPPAWVTVQDGDVPFVSPPCPRLPVPGDEAIASLVERCLSVRLYHVQHTPELGRLVNECLDEVEPHLGAEPMSRRDASVFIGSPGQVVPVHCDRHHNFLLQVTGTKELMVGRFRDPAAELASIERHYREHLNLEQMPDEVATYRLGPGDGVYLPPYSIHWVRCGPQPAVALSCSFSSPSSVRAELVHECNTYLRRLRVTPCGPGRLSDGAKAAAARAARQARAYRASRRAAG
jgi:hypothetical protein